MLKVKALNNKNYKIKDMNRKLKLKARKLLREVVDGLLLVYILSLMGGVLGIVISGVVGYFNNFIK